MAGITPINGLGSGSGSQGPAGLNGVGALEFPFAYGDSSPALITTITANKTILSVTLIITTAFNGAGASLAVGDTGNYSRHMTTSENDAGTVGGYSTTPAYEYGSNTAIYLSITPGAGASQGAGILVISIEQ